MHELSSQIEAYVAGSDRPHRARLIITIKSVRAKMRQEAEEVEKSFTWGTDPDAPEKASHEPSEWYDAVWRMREAYMDKAQAKRDEHVHRYRPFRTFNGDRLNDLHTFNMKYRRGPTWIDY